MDRNVKTQVQFPIGAKLIIIIVGFLLVSLGALTILGSVLIGSDIRITAEDNNFTVNHWAAREVEIILGNIRSKAVLLLEDMDTAENLNMASYFFTQNPDIAAIIFTTGGPEQAGGLKEKYTFINENFPGGGIPRSLLDIWQNIQENDLRRAFAGEILTDNCFPVFNIPLLAMIFPLHTTGTAESGAVTVLFSSEKLRKDFGVSDSADINYSFIINDEGCVLVHPNEELMMSGANMSDLPFIRGALESSARSLQTLFTDREGTEYFGAYERLNIGNITVITSVESGLVFKGVAATTQRNIVIGGIVLALSILVIALFSKTISKPLRTLTRAVEAVETGDYRMNLIDNRRKKSHFTDEIGILTHSFIGMGNSLENFEKFTNKTIVRLARQGKLTRTGTNKTATVCFALIRNFSDFSKEMDAYNTVKFVNSFLARIVPCIIKSGGVVDKFLTQEGVVVMSVWGVVESAGSPERDALNCIQAVLMMRSLVHTWNAERARPNSAKAKRTTRDTLIKLGCGINTGEVIAGQIGSDERMEYTVIGDAVNLAARIEGPNDLFDTDILITENTWLLTADRLITEEMPSLEVKGKEKPLRVFAVVNISDREGPQTMREVRKQWLV
ncbi:MAG: HAMP domain-containing protein [Treponema sp.]|jgi:adenylate cyclase|nr:HAMP domain-containing protein [Treponema sp.]